MKTERTGVQLKVLMLSTEVVVVVVVVVVTTARQRVDPATPQRSAWFYERRARTRHRLPR